MRCHAVGALPATSPSGTSLALGCDHCPVLGLQRGLAFFTCTDHICSAIPSLKPQTGTGVAILCAGSPPYLYPTEP